MRPIVPVVALALASGGLAGLEGCAPSALKGGFDSPNPASRMYAIEQAARTGDQSAIRHIIEELDSDDPAVRFMAINALERLTGETHGYRHYDPPEQRDAAIRRWVLAYEQGTLTLASPPTDEDSLP